MQCNIITLSAYQAMSHGLILASLQLQLATVQYHYIVTKLQVTPVCKFSHELLPLSFISVQPFSVGKGSDTCLLTVHASSIPLITMVTALCTEMGTF